MANYKKFRDLEIEEKRKYFRLIFYMSLCFNLMFLGGTLNQIAVTLNDNRMPVLMYEGTYTGDGKPSYFLDIKEAKVYPLADIIKIGNSICSVGDFVISISFLLFLIVCVKLGILDHKTRKIR